MKKLFIASMVLLACACTDKKGSETDQAQIDSDKETSANRVKYGGIAVGAGAVVGLVGNFLINADSIKGKSSELLDEREKIVADIRDVMQQVVDECNKNIKDIKENILTESAYNALNLEEETNRMPYSDYVAEIQNLVPIENLDEIQKIKDISVCK